MEPQPGQTYRHYKGGMYRIITLAKNNQTDDLYDMVVYQDVTAPEKVWTQSLERFMGDETKDGNTFSRFELVS